MDNEYAFRTAVGWIEITWTPQGLRTLSLFGEEPANPGPPHPAWVEGAAEKIARFLAGEPADLDSIPLDLEGHSPFACRVLAALRATRPGETLTYGHLAGLAGSPGASRAVGQVMARNPLPILIPCHRVVAAQGPGGFTLFGSLDTKERLMALERHPG